MKVFIFDLLAYGFSVFYLHGNRCRFMDLAPRVLVCLGVRRDSDVVLLRWERMNWLRYNRTRVGI